MKHVRWLSLSVFFAAANLAHGASVDLLLVAPDDATLQPVLAQLAAPATTTHAAWTFWRGQLHGKSVVLTRSEGDPLNATAATTLALRRYPPRLVVVFGRARAHDPGLRAGDIVVSERFAAFDGMISPIAPLDGGSDALQWARRPHLLVTVGEKETATEAFAADASALAIARALPSGRGSAHVGVLGSAHQINREADRIAWLRQHWKTSTEDGESAHVAGCATLLGVPVIGFRIVDGPPAEIAGFTLRFVAAWK